MAVALSGGVDSLCAMLMLKEAGYHVLALHGHFIDKEDVDLKSLKNICDSLSVELHIADLRQYFYEKLLRPFAKAWIDGQTPNPCSLCNREIKFGALREYAQKLGADFFATGHYAHSFYHTGYGHQVLGPAQDLKKDQSYFLALLPPERLNRLLFPLARFSKDECRAIVAAAGFRPPSADESQDICFLGTDESHADFVEKWARAHCIPKAPPGPIYILERDESGKINKKQAGIHKGLWHYTTGQRKGLGLPYSEALYVLGKAKDSESLLVAPRSALVIRSCQVGSLNIFVSQERWPSELYSRLRYRQKPAKVKPDMKGNKLCLEFEEPQFPGAEGQVATLEDAEGVILAAGLIEQMCFTN